MSYLDKQDSLTTLPNRRVLDIDLERVLAVQRDNGRPFAVLFAGVDNFVYINHHLGHQVGNVYLCALAWCLRQILARDESVYRVGGDEFVVLMPDADLEQATARAEAIRGKVLELSPKDDKFKARNLTLSIGVIACAASDEIEPKALIVEADKLMYAAKVAGKNRVHARWHSSESA